MNNLTIVRHMTGKEIGLEYPRYWSLYLALSDIMVEEGNPSDVALVQSVIPDVFPITNLALSNMTIIEDALLRGDTKAARKALIEIVEFMTSLLVEQYDAEATVSEKRLINVVVRRVSRTMSNRALARLS
jgi:hypothetical protein